jgi:hypothetical protein
MQQTVPQTCCCGGFVAESWRHWQLQNTHEARADSASCKSWFLERVTADRPMCCV